MEARNRSLTDWFTRLRTHQIVLPRFQRYESWNHGQVASLLSTILRGLPAGAVLTLEVGESEPFVSRPIADAPCRGDKVVEHLLDGQQRLTALWRSLSDSYEDRTYFVRLGPDKETREPYAVESYARWTRDGKKYPLWADSPVDVLTRELVPVSLLRPDPKAEVVTAQWAKDASGDDIEKRMEVFQTLSRLRHIFASYNIPFLSLPSTTDKETALNVFIQMNTSATPLSAYDIVVAQVEEGAGWSLHELVDLLLDTAPSVGYYIEASSLMLSVSAILQDRTPTKSTFLSSNFSERMIDNWDFVEKGIRRVVEFLEEEKILDGRRLPSDVVMSPLAALWSKVAEGLDQEGEARSILRKYLWRSFFTGRYDRTSATRALVDYRQIRDLMAGQSEQIPLIFDESEYPLPSVEALATAGWPRRRDSIARGLLALALRAGGNDFADDTPVSRKHLERREYHHLFPKAWLSKFGYKEITHDTAVNCALVTWKTNRNLSSKAPSEYIADRMKESKISEDQIRTRIESHLIPYDALVSDSFEVFRKKRAEMLNDAMIRVCRGEA